MAFEFSEVVWFVSDPQESATQYMGTLGWTEIERFGDTWILLGTPGGGKIGFMRHTIQSNEPWPPPMIAFKSASIKKDVNDARSKGLEISDVVEGVDMWHATHVDPYGNKILIWQEPE